MPRVALGLLLATAALACVQDGRTPHATAPTRSILAALVRSAPYQPMFIQERTYPAFPELNDLFASWAAEDTLSHSAREAANNLELNTTMAARVESAEILAAGALPYPAGDTLIRRQVHTTIEIMGVGYSRDAMTTFVLWRFGCGEQSGGIEVSVQIREPGDQWRQVRHRSLAAV